MLEQKIDKLLEESLSKELKKKLKAAGLGAIGGAIGAGLDVYFNDGRHLSDYIKPLTAWAAGGAAGSLLQNTADDKDEDNENTKSKAKK